MNEIIWTVIGTGATVFTLIYAFLRNLKIDMDSKFQKMDEKFEKNDLKLDGWMKHSIAIQAEQSKRTDQLHARTDQLYQMFIDLVKEGRK